jgi:tungstate transport system permease protein
MFETFIEATLQAFELILRGDPEVSSIALRSLQVSGTATLIACAWGLPAAILLGLSSFPGRRLIRGILNALLGVPTVTLGLVLYLLLSRSGPLGVFHLLYTPLGISIGQSFLIAPIVICLAAGSLESTDVQLRDLARTLGASNLQTSITIVHEAFAGILLAVVASFNRAIAELGIAMMVGGNIRYVTRLLTTAIALETARGEVVLSISLAIILMAIVLSINVTLNLCKRD